MEASWPPGVVIVLSMVFSEIVPLWGFLGLKAMLIGFATRLVVGSRGASGVLSMVFGWCGRFPLRFCGRWE